MPVPATNGVLRENILDMKIGDYIKFGHDGSSWFIGDNSNVTKESSIEGNSNTLANDPRFWYGVKVAKGLIISDRVCRTNWSWDALNSEKYIEGLPITLNGTDGVLRSLTGGNAYSDGYGNRSLIDLEFGAFPTNNEWDKYVITFPANLIQNEKTWNDVFFNFTFTWTQDTSVNGFVNVWNGTVPATSPNARRIVRRELIPQAILSNETLTTTGFRPIFEYVM